MWMDPENFSYQRNSPHANAVEVPDSFQAGILLSAVESFQKRRYPDAGTSPTKFHSENYWVGAVIVLGAITCPVYVLSGKATLEVPHYIHVAYYGRSSPKHQ